MQRAKWPLRCLLLLFALLSVLPVRAQKEKPAKKASKEDKAASAVNLSAVLWRDPGEISSLDLIYGIGGKEHAPGENEQYKFVKEDLNGTSTKFYVEDQEGVQWLVKIGPEAQTETAATRLVWAMGYFTDEDYYVHSIHVSDIPHLHRGSREVPEDGNIAGARLKRQNKTEKNIGNWDWSDNPFLNTREFDGLRVMMALINNWDLKTENNKIYDENNTEKRYVVSDEGATFGRTGGPSTRTKGNVQQYRNAKFIDHTETDEVNFVMATRPLPLFAPFDPPNFIKWNSIENLARHVPRANAKWIGQQLSHLTAKQIGDAFRAAGYSSEDVEAYTQAVTARIAQLNAL